MPCDQVRETTLSLHAADLLLLEKALKAEGHHVSYRGHDGLRFRTADGYNGRYANGKLTVDEGAAMNRDPNSLKRAYSREVVKKATSGAGWRLRFTEENVAIGMKRRMN